MKKNEFKERGLYEHMSVEKRDGQWYRIRRLFICTKIHGDQRTGRTIEFREVASENQEPLKGIEKMNMCGEHVCMVTQFDPTRENGNTYIINAMNEVE